MNRADRVVRHAQPRTDQNSRVNFISYSFIRNYESISVPSSTWFRVTVVPRLYAERDSQVLVKVHCRDEDNILTIIHELFTSRDPIVKQRTFPSFGVLTEAPGKPRILIGKISSYAS